MKNSKVFIPGLFALMFGIIGALSIQACKPQKTLAKPIYVYRPLIINQYKHDTIKVIEKTMTPEQYRAIQKEFYESNYTHLFAPEFVRLESVISNQANSISLLTATLKTMRERSIRRTDSMQNVLNSERKEALSMQKIIDDRYRTTVTQNQKEINSFNHLTVWIEFCICIIFSIIIIFGIILYWFWNEIKSLRKKINYV